MIALERKNLTDRQEMELQQARADKTQDIADVLSSTDIREHHKANLQIARELVTSHLSEIFKKYGADIDTTITNEFMLLIDSFEEAYLKYLIHNKEGSYKKRCYGRVNDIDMYVIHYFNTHGGITNGKVEDRKRLVYAMFHGM